MLIAEKKTGLLFLRIFFLFLLPYWLLLVVTVFLFGISGELTSIPTLVAKQKTGQSLLVGLAYGNPVHYYKMLGTIERQPKILALGSSRVMQFRSQFFRSPDAFYNAGGAVDRLDYFRTFLNNIPPGQEPELLIIGLDQEFFSKKWQDSLPPEDIENKFNSTQSRSDILLLNWLTIYKDWFKGKFLLEKIIYNDLSKKIGFNAIVRNNGFRNDGSRYEGQIINNAIFEKRQKDIAEWGSESFFGDRIVAKSLEELNLFLKEAADRGIYVAGFAPPYASALYKEKFITKENFDYIFKLESAVAPIFKKYLFPFYDFSDPLLFGSSDSEMLNYNHGSEKAYLRLLIKMSENDNRLNQYVNIDNLRQRLQDSSSNLQVFSE